MIICGPPVWSQLPLTLFGHVVDTNTYRATVESMLLAMLMTMMTPINNNTTINTRILTTHQSVDEIMALEWDFFVTQILIWNLEIWLLPLMHGIMAEISTISYKPEWQGMAISCGHICITNMTMSLVHPALPSQQPQLWTAAYNTNKNTNNHHIVMATVVVLNSADGIPPAWHHCNCWHRLVAVILLC